MGLIFCTKAALDRKLQEQRDLQQEMKETSARVSEAAERGDLRENSEYQYGKLHLDECRTRMAQLAKDLSNYRIITASEVKTSVVSIGCKVTLKTVTGNKNRCFTILGTFDADADKDIYNYEAPVCQLVLGKRVGDKVTLPFAGGQVKYTITAISNGLK